MLDDENNAQSKEAQIKNTNVHISVPKQQLPLFCLNPTTLVLHPLFSRRGNKNLVLPFFCPSPCRSSKLRQVGRQDTARRECDRPLGRWDAFFSEWQTCEHLTTIQANSHLRNRLMKHRNKGAKFQDGWRQKKEKKSNNTSKPHHHLINSNNKETSFSNEQ